MRKELEIIEKIEAWLEGRLTPIEAAEFETQLANDPALQVEVELQRQLMTGIDRASLKEQVNTAKRRYKLRRQVIRWGLVGLAAAALVVALLYYKDGAHTTTRPETTRPAAALPTQSWLINPTRDTVIETKKGIVMAIPARAFLDKEDHPAQGPIALTFKEALDPASIMKAGLSTRSGQQQLSTGGMFYLDARQDNKILHIDTAHPILTQIPATVHQPNMQLYKGQQKADGTIDWVTPRPLEHELVTVDIQSLDFYPPNYLDSLGKWGYDSKDRQFTDGLYYSLAPYFYSRGLIELATDTSTMKTSKPYYHPMSCGLDPAKIKTIWSPAFQNTLLATREFEQRLHYLHIAGSDKLLDLYVDHLDWKLSDIDSLVATQLVGEAKGIFQTFAARHDGKVYNNSKKFQQLSAYYREKTTAYSEAILKTDEEYGARRARLEDSMIARMARHQGDSLHRNQQNYKEEFETNLKDACRQLGITETINPNPPAPTYYTASVTSTGWCNIDRAVDLATRTRTTLDYTDSSNGKKAIIRYTPVSFQVAGWTNYDRLYVYLLPDQLSSFLLVAGSNGVYTENLDELMKYDLVCIAYKGDQAFYFHQSGIEARTYPNIQLSAVSDMELTRQLNQTGSMTQAAGLQKENSFYRSDIMDEKRRKKELEMQELNYRITKMIFPCVRFE